MRTLYKYVPPKRANILETQMIRLTQLGDLNDPAESQPKFRASRVDWNKFVDDFADSFPKLELKEGTFRDFLNWLTPARRPIVQRRLLQGVLDFGTGIFSLSSSRRVEAMWSHYSDAHRGLVIGFNASHRFFWRSGCLLMRVRYADHIDFFPYLEDLDAESLLCTKSSSWAYEREWRFIRSIAGTKKFLRGRFPKTPRGYNLWLERVPAGAFCTVTLGARAAKKLRARVVRALSKASFRHVSLYQAILGRDGRLTFRRLDPVQRVN